MIRRDPGTFRTTPGNAINVQDSQLAPGSAFSPGVSQHTAGATILEEVNLTTASPTADTLKLIGLTINAQIGLIYQAGAPSYFGKLGRVVGGLTLTGQRTVGPGIATWVIPQQPLPSDLSLVGDIWNHDNDPTPPVITAPAAPPAGPQNLQIGLSLTLPQPVILPRGNDLCIGIWQMPSFVAAMNPGVPAVYPIVLAAVWSLVYDDGT